MAKLARGSSIVGKDRSGVVCSLQLAAAAARFGNRSGGV
uniref:Uncharacterized protein n=1 Tax=Arundo donax TaxID=35708 RepID=A0A0A8ZZD9_ARUDO